MFFSILNSLELHLAHVKVLVTADKITNYYEVKGEGGVISVYLLHLQFTSHRSSVSGPFF